VEAFLYHFEIFLCMSLFTYFSILSLRTMLLILNNDVICRTSTFSIIVEQNTQSGFSLSRTIPIRILGKQYMFNQGILIILNTSGINGYILLALPQTTTLTSYTSSGRLLAIFKVIRSAPPQSPKRKNKIFFLFMSYILKNSYEF